MISSTTKTIAAAFAVAAALGATTAQAASAKGGDGVRVAGTCSDSSTSKLKLKRDNGRLKVEFEVDQNRTGVPWTVELRKDGRLVFQGTRTHGRPERLVQPRAPHRRHRRHHPRPRIAQRRDLLGERAACQGLACRGTAGLGHGREPGSNGAAGGSAVSDDGVGHDVNDDHGHHGNDD